MVVADDLKRKRAEVAPRSKCCARSSRRWSLNSPPSVSSSNATIRDTRPTLHCGRQTDVKSELGRLDRRDAERLRFARVNQKCPSKSRTCEFLKCYYIRTKHYFSMLGVIMFAFNMSSPAEVIRGLAERMKRRRIQYGLTQRDLAERSNVSYGSLRLFEKSGKISLESLVKIAFVLEAEAQFDQLFPGRQPQNIDDVVDRPLKQRVRRK